MRMGFNKIRNATHIYMYVLRILLKPILFVLCQI